MCKPHVHSLVLGEQKTRRLKVSLRIIRPVKELILTSQIFLEVHQGNYSSNAHATSHWFPKYDSTITRHRNWSFKGDPRMLVVNKPLIIQSYCGVTIWGVEQSHEIHRFPAVTMKSEARLWVVIILGKAGGCPEAWGAARSWGQWRPRPWETRGWRDDGMMRIYITVKHGNINITNVIYEPLGTFFCPRRLGSRIIRHFHPEVCKTRKIYIDVRFFVSRCFLCSDIILCLGIFTRKLGGKTRNLGGKKRN